MIFVGIDPGSSSGAVAQWVNGNELIVHHMPEDLVAQWDLFMILRSSRSEQKWAMEDVGSTRPGNSAKSAFTFATHVGGLRMAMVGLQIPHVRVLPQKWMKDLWHGNHPKGMERAQVEARKKFIYERMQRLYPTAWPKYAADAVAIMHWLRIQTKDVSEVGL